MSKYNENAFINDIRLLALNMAYKSKITYNNSILSVVPILYTLYKDHLVFDVDKPEWCNRDRLVLSNGNASPALYATLYTALGKYKQEDLEEYGSYKSNLSVYPSYDLDKSIEVTTTSSGEGLSMAIGMAIAEKNLESLYNKKKITLFNYNIYSLCNYRDLTSASGLGSASVCSKYNLDNLIILYDAINREDNNKIMDMYLSMDFNVILVKNSSKLSEVSKALDSANKNRRPTLIIFESNEDKNSAYEIGNKILGSIKEEDMKRLTDILTVEDKKYNFEEAIKLYRQEIKERNKEGLDSMTFTIESAKQVLDDYYDLVHPQYEDDIQFINALEFLIQETNNPEYMVELGGWYYGQKQFDLAEDYYLMAAKLNYVDAYECLGYIYYYGRVGQPDYEKAFHYYKLASDQGNIVAAYKLADMYKNGYYVQKDYPKYVQIIKSLYPLLQGATNTFDPVPEVYSRLAKIYVEEGNEDQAIQLLLIAKEFQSQRLIYSDFFGDLTIIKHIVLDLYSLIQFDSDYMDLFDLYYVLQKLVLCQEKGLLK